MLVAIYGGSFNPLHYGHTGLAAWVAANTDVDEVWLMVTPNNPLKKSAILADEQQRLQAARQEISRLQKENTLKGIARVRVCDFEFGLPRPSYTANTLRELRKAYPEHRFALLIGQDNWAIRRQWREWESIQANYPIYIYPRGKEGMSAIRRETEGQTGEIHLLEDAPLFDISSTELRERSAAGGK
ncbi:MAG: nicotinate (nicotinamide) nucleotide adenylyltransferase [Paludibacteraceae bacterium]|nr:nicotinate (nicotinamide) nucleotide adenylyltransferase [Paludibacteraceae bacterium]